MVFCCLNQDLQDSDGFSGWIDLREGMENIFFPRRDAKGREERLFCCLNQDLLDFSGFSGWIDLREGMENIFFPRRDAKGREERPLPVV